MKRFLAMVLGLLVLGVGAAGAQTAPDALVHLPGSEFNDGAKDLFGSFVDGESVNYVYAQPTGKPSSMSAKFNLSSTSSEPLFVHLKARDDDHHTHCPITIQLNGRTLFDGPNGFSNPQWQTVKFAIPPHVLRVGENTITISNRAAAGVVGMPPWFQVANCVIAPEQYVIRRDLTKDFWVKLPAKVEAFPAPLAQGKQPGFKFRGIKGWMWTPAQYLSVIPFLAQCKMNFLMNCYTSMCDIEHFRWGDPNVNRWWEDFPQTKKAAYEQVVHECQRQGITFCFSMNPNLSSKRFVSADDPASVDALYKHYAWMQSLGVKWFNISLDDIQHGINPANQAKVVNEIFHRLRSKDPEAQMIFCPTYYWGDGTGKEQQPYLQTLADTLDQDVYLFWTGDSVVGRISRRGADSFRAITKHRMFLWDNYPVNDGRPTMHLGPVMNRDADLCEVIDGYMSNSMCQQTEANRIPMFTCADYSWNPWDYDPERSIGQAIVHLADTDQQRLLLRDLVELYAGMFAYSVTDDGFNAVQEQYNRIAALPNSRQDALAFIQRLDSVAGQMKEQFPNRYTAAKVTLDNDIQSIKQRYQARYGE